MKFFLFLIAAVGLGVGSFINCVVYRVNNGLAPLKGRSICPRCKHQLAWKDNIPLLSFILLRGKCRYCGKPISWQYPIVELITGLLAIIIFQLSNCELRIASYNLLIGWALLAIFVSDLVYTTIPDEIVFPTMGLVAFFHLAGVEVVASPPPSGPNGFLGGVLLVALGAAGFFYFLVLVTKGRGMGMGDVKLVFLMGFLLGWPKIMVAIYLAFLTGAIIGVILILIGKKKFGQTIPFGPFLVTGTIIALFWGEKIFSWWLKII